MDILLSNGAVKEPFKYNIKSLPSKFYYSSEQFPDLLPPGNDETEEASELEDIFLAGGGPGVGLGGLSILSSLGHAPLHRCFR